MSQPVAVAAVSSNVQAKARKSTSSNIQWPEFKVTQPDPVLGKELLFSYIFCLSFILFEDLQARYFLGKVPLLQSRP